MQKTLESAHLTVGFIHTCFQVTNKQKQEPLLERVGGANLLQRGFSSSSCKRKQKGQYLSTKPTLLFDLLFPI